MPSTCSKDRFRLPKFSHTPQVSSDIMLPPFWPKTVNQRECSPVTCVCVVVLNEEQEQFLRELVGPVGKFFEVPSVLVCST